MTIRHKRLIIVPVQKQPQFRIIHGMTINACAFGAGVILVNKGVVPFEPNMSPAPFDNERFSRETATEILIPTSIYLSVRLWPIAVKQLGTHQLSLSYPKPSLWA